ncbi:HGL185Wp [Eremothecium sinecaudum]|uniref:HGL185Wp n=1 Tax=Eremothecium sinecaudum TaxID=45286 RepID=A0A109UZY4_9SACH|nr:HGL185Wp [Eremothecium sinecaudum]AMD22155.1 HGL185Wp [Eremothecium sinecaudum]
MRPVLFEIRLNTCEDGTVVMNGPPEDSPSVFLAGSLVLSITKPIFVKLVSLDLYGKLIISSDTLSQGIRFNLHKPLKHTKTVYHHSWGHNELWSNTKFRTGIDLPVRPSDKPLSRLGSLRKCAKALKLTDMDDIEDGSRILDKGNYEIPFSVLLPGSLEESVEGLDNVSLRYSLIAVIERGRFRRRFKCKKNIKVIRTLTPDALQLTQTTGLDKTWAGKVDYSIYIPAKAVAIGDLIPVHIKLVPLEKGLRLGSIQASVIEQLTIVTPDIPKKQTRRLVQTVYFNHRWLSVNSGDEEPAGNPPECWEIDGKIQLPPYYTACVQDCKLLDVLKIRHHLRLVINFLDLKGHVWKLRTSLPFQCFISPSIPLTECPDRKKFLITYSDLEISANQPLFAHSKPSPPLYGRHISDTLWNEEQLNNIAITTESAGPSIPLSPNCSMTLSMSSMHEVQRTHADHEGTSPSWANLGNNSSINNIRPSFVDSVISAEQTVRTFSSLRSSVENTLTVVPSYETAIKTTYVGQEFPPEYPPLCKGLRPGKCFRCRNLSI